MLLCQWAIPEKNPSRGGGLRKDIFFEPPPSLEFLGFSLYPWKFQRKQAFTSGNSAKLSDTPWKFQGQKPIPMKFPHDFFLISPGNSIF